ELAVIHVSLATTFGDLRNHVRAVHHYRQELALQGRLYEDLYRAYFNLGNIHLREGEHSGALRCLARARDCARKMKEKGMESECCGPAEFGDPPAALALCEQLGDAFSKHGDYRRAVEYYQKQLSFAQELQRPAGELAVIHVSLATTFGDLRNHVRAVHHYRQELALHRGNALEASWGLGGSLWVPGGFLGALRCSLGGLPRSLGGFPEYLGAGGRGDRGGSPTPRGGVPWDPRVGHPLNPRDYCGWTPLHEACNHGHLEIVRLLLDRGAALDDPGGPGCEGITPLHDALSCGHFEVAELLV
uniref:Tonsoku-like protein n=1 Tax=Buteo japonicus TaxID=224669 RepID=A0A8C0AYU9_9AVES